MLIGGTHCVMNTMPHEGVAPIPIRLLAIKVIACVAYPLSFPTPAVGRFLRPCLWESWEGSVPFPKYPHISFSPSWHWHRHWEFQEVIISLLSRPPVEPCVHCWQRRWRIGEWEVEPGFGMSSISQHIVGWTIPKGVHTVLLSNMTKCLHIWGWSILSIEIVPYRWHPLIESTQGGLLIRHSQLQILKSKHCNDLLHQDSQFSAILHIE